MMRCEFWRSCPIFSNRCLTCVDGGGYYCGNFKEFKRVFTLSSERVNKERHEEIANYLMFLVPAVLFIVYLIVFVLKVNGGN